MAESRKPPHPQIDFDKVLKHIGEYGRFQVLATVVLAFIEMPCALHAMASVFEAAAPDFTCDVVGGATMEKNPTFDGEGWDVCAMYGTEIIVGPFTPNDTTRVAYTSNALQNETATCNHFRYDTSVFTSTIVTEWNLVCDRAWMKAFSTSMFMLGNLIGVIIFGHVADRFGRKCLLWLTLFLVLTGCTVTFAPNVWSYIFLRLVTGSLTMGIIAISFTHGIEILGVQHRVLFDVIATVGFSSGIIGLAAIAYFVRDYAWLQLAISLFAIIFVPPLYWIGESPRWLLRKGKFEEAERQIRKMARWNKCKLPSNLWACDEFINDTKEEESFEQVQQNVFVLLKFPRMRCNTFNVWFYWVVVAMVYYGLALGSSDLAGNPFINLALAGLVELPALILVYFTLDRFGRRVIQTGSLAMSGVACLLVPAMPSGITWLIITLTMAGKFFVSVGFATIYVYTAEMYPTPVRVIGLGASSMFARVGSLLAPFVADLSNLVWPSLTQVVFGSLSLLAASLSIMLPETKGHTLPETLEDGERFAKTGTCYRESSSTNRVNGVLSVKENGNTEKEVELAMLKEQGSTCNA